MGIKEKLAKGFDLPSEVAGGYKVTITSGLVEIENYKGIMEYSEGFVKVKMGERTAAMEGEKLEILEMTDDNIQIKGIIKKIEF